MAARCCDYSEDVHSKEEYLLKQLISWRDRIIQPLIREHCFYNDHPFKISKFNSIDSTAQVLNLRILESIHIHINRQKITNNQTATTLYILDIT